jgi:hypothetical protein
MFTCVSVDRYDAVLHVNRFAGALLFLELAVHCFSLNQLKKVGVVYELPN